MIEQVSPTIKFDNQEQAELEMIRRILLRLACISMLPGSADKRFVRDMVAREPGALTVNQRNAVRRLAYKYRRQMPASLVPSRVQAPAKVAR